LFLVVAELCAWSSLTKMGSILDKILIDPNDFVHTEGGVFKILFLLVVYGFILFKASNLISDGSELLLLIPSVAGIVGSVVLPILGAVPDGMIVLFSGSTQEDLAVGVGALAGSTIMLLTIPWFFSLLAGRVSLDENGVGAYRKKEKLSDPKWHLWRTGTNVKAGLRVSAIIMIITSVSYLLIQGPAFKYAGRTDNGSGSESDSDSSEVKREHYWALAGFILSVLMFIGYLVYQVVTANKESNKDKIAQVQHDAISKSLMSVSAVFAEQLFAGEALSERSSLMVKSETKARFDAILREFFNRHDLDGNGVVDAHEMRGLLADLGEYPTKEEFDTLMKQMDTNHDGTIQYTEFHDSLKAYVKHLYDKDNGVPSPLSVVIPDESDDNVQSNKPVSTTNDSVNATGSELKTTGEEDVAEGGEGDEEGEEEEEVPDDLTHLSPKQQRIRIILRSAWMMGLGVLLVVIFSDPMVDVFSALGKQFNINSFYIAFILGPLASNASELIAAISYARKKTVRTATIGCESLIGAACMNNTFCLSIFLILIYANNFRWHFSAETISILFVELCMLVFAVQRTQRLFFGIFIILLYPLSIGLVALLESKYVNWN